MNNSNLGRKLQSRKFWIAVAAMLASMGAGLAGLADPNVCAVLMALSAGIYAFCEAYVDGKDRAASQSNVTTVFEAKTVDKDTVQAYLSTLTGGE